MAHTPIQNALVSVSDKTDLLRLCRTLAAGGVTIYSTGGTRRHLEEGGLSVRDVADYTGFPEMMEGRLKTLHPKVFGGILCRRDRAEDMAAAAAHGIIPFELVVVNLYPFAATVARPDATPAEAIEQIDIGGPSLVRAAAKNHAFTAIATSPSQYEEILAEIRATGGTTLALRARLAAAAFAHTAQYDAAIAEYFEGQQSDGPLPKSLRLHYQRREGLRYGENPHQPAALYAAPGTEACGRARTLVAARRLSGKELSYNNLLDLDSALALVRSLNELDPRRAAAVVVKHNNPCGAAAADALATAMRAALDGDPLSAFGGIVGVSRPLDAATAEVLVEPDRFIEAIVAPDFAEEALQLLTSKPKWKASVRLLAVGAPDAAATPSGVSSWQLRQIDGGLLVQRPDAGPDQPGDWKVVTAKQPTDAELADLRFAWSVVRHVKSNAIVLARGRAVCGVGAGQMSRVDATEIALKKAGDRAAASALASDAFFPFVDSVELAAAAGVTAVIQPGGSRRDDEVIAACDRRGVAMVFTHRRHFRH